MVYDNPNDYFNTVAQQFKYLKCLTFGNNGYRREYSMLGSTAIPVAWHISEESLLKSPELAQQFKKPLNCVCGPPKYMGEMYNEGSLESFYHQIIILPVARALERIGLDIRIHLRLPIIAEPLHKNTTQSTTMFTPDGTICGSDRQPYLVFEYKYAYNTTALDSVDGASPLNNSYVGQMIHYCSAANISDAIILKEDALIFLHITGPPQDDIALTELSDALSDADPSSPFRDAKRPRTAGSSMSANLPQRKRTALERQESPDHLANSSPNRGTTHGTKTLPIHSTAPDSDPLAQAPSTSPPSTPDQLALYLSESYRPSSGASQRLEGIGAKFSYHYKIIPIDTSDTWLPSIFSYIISVCKAHKNGNGAMSPNMIDPLKTQKGFTALR
ncbi:hypothetical protein F5Y09DRAFT_327298 [Xylaria sp. FL1042]|nr:hypothetical protein F5Y09DRAFT_327298 [Xylaria sp. FL1042]